MRKEDVIRHIENVEEVTGFNSMGASESFYNKYYLTRQFLKRENIDPNKLKARELHLMIRLAEYAGEIFY